MTEKKTRNWYCRWEYSQCREVKKNKQKQQQKNNNLALTAHLFSFQSEVIGESVFNQIHTCLKQLNKSQGVIYFKEENLIFYFTMY